MPRDGRTDWVYLPSPHSIGKGTPPKAHIVCSLPCHLFMSATNLIRFLWCEKPHFYNTHIFHSLVRFQHVTVFTVRPYPKNTFVIRNSGMMISDNRHHLLGPCLSSLTSCIPSHSAASSNCLHLGVQLSVSLDRCGTQLLILNMRRNIAKILKWRVQLKFFIPI